MLFFPFVFFLLNHILNVSSFFSEHIMVSNQWKMYIGLSGKLMYTREVFIYMWTIRKIFVFEDFVILDIES